ncbi:uncharacterized protein MONBRDRAFT_10973 [Monosiga brevicollis MX1]|uniref:BZIP domain-containing protein n=1 Tax=Monosiga brevicollis TaxID=81824 RepID=A9V7T9_MONBE|nr:uncharacterized protein MONBRDRAFT_10973 [Monosiga brevicollis MX1]EDQ86362.1 predicted protein [Monosiga brevicollis MX1]|eukprot:XP_001748752.1 hypothetical protein [Monosiga brevicollis MX1]
MAMAQPQKEPTKSAPAFVADWDAILTDGPCNASADVVGHPGIEPPSKMIDPRKRLLATRASPALDADHDPGAHEDANDKTNGSSSSNEDGSSSSNGLENEHEDSSTTSNGETASTSDTTTTSGGTKSSSQSLSSSSTSKNAITLPSGRILRRRNSASSSSHFTSSSNSSRSNRPPTKRSKRRPRDEGTNRSSEDLNDGSHSSGESPPSREARDEGSILSSKPTSHDSVSHESYAFRRRFSHNTDVNSEWLTLKATDELLQEFAQHGPGQDLNACLVELDDKQKALEAINTAGTDAARRKTRNRLASAVSRARKKVFLHRLRSELLQLAARYQVSTIESQQFRLQSLQAQRELWDLKQPGQPPPPNLSDQALQILSLELQQAQQRVQNTPMFAAGSPVPALNFIHPHMVPGAQAMDGVNFMPNQGSGLPSGSRQPQSVPGLAGPMPTASEANSQLAEAHELLSRAADLNRLLQQHAYPDVWRTLMSEEQQQQQQQQRQRQLSASNMEGMYVGPSNPSGLGFGAHSNMATPSLSQAAAMASVLPASTVAANVATSMWPGPGVVMPQDVTTSTALYSDMVPYGPLSLSHAATYSDLSRGAVGLDGYGNYSAAPQMMDQMLLDEITKPVNNA